MFLSEDYKNDIAKLSGLNVCEKCYHRWHIKKEDKDPFFCHVCGYDSKKEIFRIDDLKIWMKDKYKNMNENIGPGGSENTNVSDIFMDIFNRKFQSKDFQRDYSVEDEIYWFDKEKKYKGDESSFDKNYMEINKEYRRVKRKNNSKNWIN